MLGTTPDWGNGWEQVENAIKIYGSYRQAEALESMDEITRDTVKRLGFYNLCMSENQTADRANFRMIYEQIAERKKRDKQIPESLRLTIQNMPLMLGEGGN